MMEKPLWQQKAEEFISRSHLYRLGVLPTEMSHPDTRELSEFAQNQLDNGIAVLKKVDQRIFKELNENIENLSELHADIQSCLADRGRIFLCGCGATGRLSLTLDYLWKEIHPQNKEQLVSFMSGGDIALVHSIEGFEDFPEYGSRHLEQLGFTKNDLLISFTEGGETPYVIGATEKANEISKYKPYFLYCNPDEELVQFVERSKKIIENPKIKKINLFVGEMALSGSTRMQASSILFLAGGLALFYRPDEYERLISHFQIHYSELDLSFLKELIKAESDIYNNNDYLIYEVDEFAITVFTDTTERAPTFNMRAFERDVTDFDPKGECSLCYVQVKGENSLEKSWQKLLNRPPHCLNWSEISHMTTLDYLKGFDFSELTFEKRKNRTKCENKFFKILDQKDSIYMELKEITYNLKKTKMGPLFDHALLKMILNIHSTLVMGRLKRYEKNIMTWVSPTNGKLIDRAARYVSLLLSNKNKWNYENIIFEIFKNLEGLKKNESIVLKTVSSLEDGISNR